MEGIYVKILRDTDWEPVGYQGNFQPAGGKPVFFFRHRKHQDIVALNVAKYIDVVNNVVYYFNAQRKVKVSVSESAKEAVSKSNIQGLLNKCGL